MSWVKVFRIIPEFRILRLTFHRGFWKFWTFTHKMSQNLSSIAVVNHALPLSYGMRFPTLWYVRPAKAQTSLYIRTVWSEPLLVAWIFYDCSATDCILSLKGGCTGSSESTLVKMSNCRKSYAAAYFIFAEKGLSRQKTDVSEAVTDSFPDD